MTTTQDDYWPKFTVVGFTPELRWFNKHGAQRASRREVDREHFNFPWKSYSDACRLVSDRNNGCDTVVLKGWV